MMDWRSLLRRKESGQGEAYRSSVHAGERPMQSDESHLDEEVAEHLREVLDPEIGLNVVDLGLVYIARRRGRTIDVTLTLTSRACPLGELVLAQVRDRLSEAYPEHELNVELVWTPSWTPDLITDRGYQLMGRERTRTLI